MPQLSQEQLKELGLTTLADRVSEHVFKNALTELLNNLSDEALVTFDAIVEESVEFEQLAKHVAQQYPHFVDLLDKHQAVFVEACVAQLETAT